MNAFLLVAMFILGVTVGVGFCAIKFCREETRLLREQHRQEKVIPKRHDVDEKEGVDKV